MRGKRRTGILVSILALLFMVGLVPLLWTSYFLVEKGAEILEADQRVIQHDKVVSLSNYVESFVAEQLRYIRSVARGLAISETQRSMRARIDSIRAESSLEQFF
jgi:hypothetical protein